MKFWKLWFVVLFIVNLSACGGVSQVVPSHADAQKITQEKEAQQARDAAIEAARKAKENKSSVEVYGAVEDPNLDKNALNAQSIADEALRKAKEAEAQSFKPVVYFNYDQAQIDQKSIETIVHYANYLNENTQEKITLTGHTDARGTPEYNLALGEKRAKSVKEVFMLYGVGESRIEVVTMGEESPAVDEQTEAAWALNRRVEFAIHE